VVLGVPGRSSNLACDADPHQGVVKTAKDLATRKSLRVIHVFNKDRLWRIDS